jgi:hypothetical protein
MPSSPLGDPISSLTEATSLDGTETVAVVQNTKTKRSLLSTIADYVIQTATSFAQSGTAPTSRTVEDVERAIVRSGDFALNVNYLARLEALTETIGVARLNIQTENGIRFQTEDAPFTLSAHQTTFNGTVDNVLQFGYNVTEGAAGTRIDTAEPYLKLSLESDYNNGSAHLMEVNLDYLSDDGLTAIRFSSFNVDRSTHVGAWAFAGTSLKFWKTDVETGPHFDIDLTNLTSTEVITLRVAGGSNEQFQFGPATAGVLTTFSFGFGALSGSGGTLSTTGTEVAQKIGATSVTMVTATGLGVFANPSQAFDVTKSNNGTDVIALVANTSNTASSGSRLNLQVAGTSGGDAWIHMRVAGVASWAMGLDNSDADAFVISEAIGLGSNNRFKIAAGGVVTIPSLAGTGSRTVVADANGVLSAP